MHPIAVRFSHTHGSASRRRSSFVTSKSIKKHAPVTTPVEKHAHEAVEEAAKIQAA
jgi:hypothetical protein